jgi:hypothetical protein
VALQRFAVEILSGLSCRVGVSEDRGLWERVWVRGGGEASVEEPSGRLHGSKGVQGSSKGVSDGARRKGGAPGTRWWGRKRMEGERRRESVAGEISLHQ